jgi:hypothetical protein
MEVNTRFVDVDEKFGANCGVSVVDENALGKFCVRVR